MAVDNKFSDQVTTVGELKKYVEDFVVARNWTRSHSPKNLAMSIAIEAAEIMEHFQWGDREDFTPELLGPEKIDEIRMEVADVMIYMLSFCRALGIDLAEAVQSKQEKNEVRFPVDVVRFVE
ncbi:NTP pyrophosphatase (non-canonical NTP hydrolase) [Tumebacillus sp. BK434]|uniref:nucleotide pyrophosphohydrolase n=1 Tax=Tumebacillus sp. BK434 TaxID=2512169 RepID=UPI0010473863|nr:nucleotide pyrophosphohydrolase [Tumebacillus sp. BK434]TCP58272.1 NTP pyrophosphatase (non-canonical NTP hydrolase) [Tumebacillus sp. BK434]